MPVLTPLGEYIETAREKRRLSQRAASRAALMSNGYWRAVVAGARTGTRQTVANPTPGAVVAMARAVGADPVRALSLAGVKANAAEVDRLWEEWSAGRTPDEPDTPPLPRELDELIRQWFAADDQERRIIRGQVRLLLDDLRELLAGRRVG